MMTKTVLKRNNSNEFEFVKIIGGEYDSMFAAIEPTDEFMSKPYSTMEELMNLIKDNVYCVPFRFMRQKRDAAWREMNLLEYILFQCERQILCVTHGGDRICTLFPNEKGFYKIPDTYACCIVKGEIGLHKNHIAYIAI